MSENENKKILVIDDEKLVCTAMARELGDNGYTVETALSGEEGIDKVRGESYDLIYIDMIMPGLDGVETCRTIKGIHPEANIICFTGVIDSKLIDKEAAFQDAGGKIYYLYKPFSEDELLTVTRKALAVA